LLCHSFIRCGQRHHDKDDGVFHGGVLFALQEECTRQTSSEVLPLCLVDDGLHTEVPRCLRIFLQVGD
jgi:hypothetical protein